jgi:hypothetical protein
MPLDDDIVASRGDRQAPKLSDLDAELDGMLAAKNSPPAAATTPPVPAGLQAPPRKEPGVWNEVSRAVGGGIRDAAQNTLDLAHDLGSWTGEHLLGLRMATGPSSRINLPKVAENQTTVGKVGRSITQFIIPFLGASKALGYAAPAMGAIKKGLVAGAATDAAAFDPHEKRLSNMVMEMSDNDPVFGKAAFEYLAANPNDTNAEGRFKNALEGAGIGMAVEGLFKGLRVIKAHYAAKGQQADESVRKAAEAAAKEAEEAKKVDAQNQVEADKAIKEYDAKAAAKAMPLRDQIDALTGANKKQTPDYNKRLDVIAATRTTPQVKLDPRPSPYTTTNTKGREPLVAQFQAAQKAVSDGTAHRAILDSDGTVVFTKDAPGPAEVDLGTRVKLVMDTPPAQRAAEDLVALRAYRQLQDAAFPGLAKAGDTATPSGKPVSTSDDIAAAIREKDLEIARMHSGKQNSALTDPSVLAQMAAAPAAGGIAGAASGDEDDDFATRLTLGFGAALAVWGIKARVGKSKVLTPAEKEVISNPDPVVKSLARPEVANIAPVKGPEVLPKKAPVISGAKVKTMVDAAVKGDYSGVSQTLKESDFNLDRIDTPEDVKQLVDGFSSVFEKEHTAAKHGVQSFDQTKELAEELGSGTETLKQMFQGTDNLAARVLAHRALLTASAEKVSSLAKLAMTGDADAILALRKHVALHASIQAQMKGVQTEIARALGQFRITAKSVDLAVNERNELIEAMGGHRSNVEFAQKLADISDPKKLNAVVRGTAMARTKDALFEGWINGLLSGPATHVVNMVGNSLTAVNSVAERLTASMVGKVLLTGPDAIPMGEATAQLFGMTEGLMDAVRITDEGLQAIRRGAGQVVKGDLKGARETIASNEAEFGGMWQAAGKDMPQLDSAAFATKELRGDSITAQNFDLDPNSMLGAFADGLGALVRLPGRALTTSDELFKTIHYRGELKAQAYRMARAEGLEGDELFKRIGALVEDPTPALRAQAMNAAREGTFTTPLGSKGASLQNLVQNVPGARYLMPFVRTPINLMKFVGVRTPGLNMLAESVRTEFKAGGVRRDIMVAKTMMGGSLYALGGMLAANGVITGGGEKDQSAERLGGIQPYSVKFGDKYYAINRFDPFGAFFGIAADMSDISGHIGSDESDNLAAMATLAISRNLVSKSYLSGLVEFLDTVNSGSEQKWERFVQRQASTFIPFSAGSNAVRREVDPEVKEIWSVIDAVKAKIPGFSKDVPPLVNIFGEDVHYKGGLGPDIASPIYTSEKSTEPAAAEIARLNLDLRNPPRTIAGGSGAPGIDLSPQQYHRYMKLIGGGDKGTNGFKADVTKLVQSEAYKRLPEDPDNTKYVEAKEMNIKLLFEAHKKRALAQLIQGDPQLKQAFTQNIMNKGNALSGKPVLGIPLQQ